jgi:hypothetical protein
MGNQRTFASMAWQAKVSVSNSNSGGSWGLK